MAFRERIKQNSTDRKSNIILALDFPFVNSGNRQGLLSEAERVLDAACPNLCAVKFNHHLVLPLGLFDGVQKLVQRVHDTGLVAIMDCKANDIGATNQAIAEYYYAAGFDAVIANPFIGWEEGLKPIFDVANRLNRGVILLVYMSHKAAPEGYGQTVVDKEMGKQVPQYVAFAHKALRYGASGAVVGATYPERIREVHAILGDNVPIYSPGIGAQGGDTTAALRAGSRYLIVGRSVTGAKDPAKAAEEARDLART